MSKFTKTLKPFVYTYKARNAYINVSYRGIEIDVINLSHLPGESITRDQFLAEVRDSHEYHLEAYPREVLLDIAKYV